MGNTSNFDNENQKKIGKSKRKKKKNILVTCRILERDEHRVFEIIKNHPPIILSKRVTIKIKLPNI